jgi:hypothetical protein
MFFELSGVKVEIILSFSSTKKYPNLMEAKQLNEFLKQCFWCPIKKIGLNLAKKIKSAEIKCFLRFSIARIP